MIIDSRKLFQQLLREFTVLDNKGEKEAILFLVLEHTLNLSRMDVMKGKDVEVSSNQVQGIIHRLNQHEPVQYILGEAEFYGRKFKVDPSVLIPRPETELLVNEAIKYIKKNQHEISILDIGTGSGCIAITLALEVPQLRIFATDITAGALLTAKENAAQLGAEVRFTLHDILNDELNFGPLDIIVSNPPYIAESEAVAMAPNVTAHEPPAALFVPDSDPLLFYRAIAKKAKAALKLGGIVIVEINERYGAQTAMLFQSIGFKEVKITQDLEGKDRLVSGNR